VRVLIFHGYLLHGTGSNVYNASIAAALRGCGHEVHLLCQDRDPWDLDWVDAAGDWDSGSLRVEARRRPASATVYRPDVAGLLPVYVADRYEGIDARPFHELADDEVERYVEHNVAAVAEVVALARPDVALANHLVMGPAILARALAHTGVPYAVKIHGSALEYTVKPHPRFRPWALEGIRGARGVLVGSRHTAESLWAALEEPGLLERTVLGPPGVDVQRFTPRAPAIARAGLADLATRLEAFEARADESSFARDPAEAARALRTVGGGDPLVVFVGKLIAAKGVELLLAAWPLVLERVPEARLLVVGFGGFRPALEKLAGDLARGDLQAAVEVRGEDGRELPELAGFLDTLEDPERYRRTAAALRDRVAWTGRLDHAELADVLPAAEAMVVPSTFPEAFGMVAAEAAACGALPVVAGHSGLAEVAASLAPAVPGPVRPLLSFPVGPASPPEIADRLCEWLALPGDLRAQARAAMVEQVRDLWSWEGVSRGVLAAAAGHLDGLPRP
jgi:glycosyltransferase involved in cell wall biosynthesis